jgi:hypothetical protein
MAEAAPDNWYSCVPNIGPRGRRRRFVMAALCLLAALGAAAYLHLAAAGPGMHTVLAVPFFLAALYYFQAREKT